MESRVHWLIYNLPSCITRAYKLEFDYLYHNYFLVRYKGRRLCDLFVVVRSSRRCWRCMYYHSDYTYFEYFSEKTSADMARHIEKIYRKIRKSELKEDT